MSTQTENLILELARRIKYRNTIAYHQMSAANKCISEHYTETLKGRLLVALENRKTKRVVQ